MSNSSLANYTVVQNNNFTQCTTGIDLTSSTAHVIDNNVNGACAAITVRAASFNISSNLVCGKKQTNSTRRNSDVVLRR